MPTTVEKAQKKKSQKQPGSKSLDLLCSVKYKNTLPDIPFDAKFLSYPFDTQRFIQYNPTSLERSHKHDLLTEPDLGVPIDLIMPDTYPRHSASTILDPGDEALLEDEVVQQPESKRAKQHAKSVSWLRRTEYISTEFARPHSATDGAETKVGYNVKKKLQGMDVYKDRASQIAAIEATFEAAKQPITKHYSKPGVEAKEVLPLFPDFELWKLPFAQVLYDTDPASHGKPEQMQVQEMSQAMIRGMMDENNEQFVAYFLPSASTLTKRSEDKSIGISYQNDTEYEYMLTKEYNWNVKNKASKGYEETYFLVTRAGQGVFYNEIETRVRLSKRRGKATKSAMNSKLVVKHRDLTDDEILAQESRLSQLEPAVPEEDWDEGGTEEDDESEPGDEDSDTNDNNELEQAFGRDSSSENEA